MLIRKYNSLVDQANQKVSTINESAGKEFNEGEYIYDEAGQRINIYEFTSRAELVRVLAHELGHALGLDHNSNPDSIMYYLNQSENGALTPEDSADLEALCHLS
ncbi:MAG: matrixin family metalloprotease [Patescibacteria group bacterium]